MATSKPRFTITMEPRTYRALTAMCDGTGISKAQFINQVLEENLPVLERLAAVVQAAKTATPDGLRQIGQNLRDLEKAAHRLAGGMDVATDLFLSSPDALEALEAPPEGPKRARGTRAVRAPAPPSGTAQNPPSPNRGGSSPLTSQKPAPQDPEKVVRLRDRRPAP